MTKKRGGKTRKHSSNHIFSDVFETHKKTPTEHHREIETEELRRLEREVKILEAKQGINRGNPHSVPSWFYVGSIFAAYLFTLYISVFATLHFEDIQFMNITLVFIFISMVSYFLISMVYFASEKKRSHSIPPLLFFIGLASIMIYAFKAVDTTNLVRFSIFYTIIVAAISLYVLTVRREI